MKLNKQSWLELMNSFDFDENIESFEYLIKKYSEKHRFYHNVDHIEDCLNKLNSTGIRNREIELAIWYHDIVYNSYGKDNELKSAEEMKHDEKPTTDDEKLIIDIDISILGRSKEEYLKYTESIRKEYKLIPFFYYKKKRREIMSKFLENDRLYHTEYFCKKYETQARLNIKEEIETLK